MTLGIVVSVTPAMTLIVAFHSIFLYRVINQIIVLFVMHVNLDVMYACLFPPPPLVLLAHLR